MSRTIQTKFTDHAGVEYPIICGAMYPCSNPELVSAASNGGGLAIMQPVSLTYAHGWDLRKGIKYIKSMTNKPFGFNALIEKSNKKHIERMSVWIDIALEEGIRFFVTSLGKPDWVCEKVHAVGGVVYHDVTTRHWAKKGKDSGVDGLICVNNRAGGHLGDQSKEQMFEELHDMNLPLICAGGVGGEDELNDALRLGYDGVQMGTRFIATDECNTSDNYKRAIIEANEEDISWTKRISGVPISVIKTKNFRQENSWLVRKLLSGKFKHLARTFINSISYWRLKSIKQSDEKNGSPKSTELYSAGKSVGAIDNTVSATVIMRELGESINRVKTSG